MTLRFQTAIAHAARIEVKRVVVLDDRLDIVVEINIVSVHADSVRGGLVDDNNIGAVGYMDLRASYRWSPHLQIYGAIDNVTDVAPPQIVSTSGGTGTNQMIYDALGRAIRMGVRVND